MALPGEVRVYSPSTASLTPTACHYPGARGVQKKLRETVSAVQAEHPDETVEVWGEDEARIGLKPILRRVWAPRGQRPVAVNRPAYEWLWLYAAVHPGSGEVFWLILPHLNAEMMQMFIDEFARHHTTESKRVVLVLDGATAHRAKRLRVPERITLISLPAYTPELNPTERLWPIVREGVTNRAHSSLDELEASLCRRCEKITAAEVAALTNYHWWPNA